MHASKRRLLREWSDHAAVYRALHASSEHYYKNKNASFRIPSLIITSLSAGLAFSVGMFPSSHEKYIPTLCGILNLCASTFSSIANFFKTAERAEAHRLATVSFSILSRKIKEKLIVSKDIPDDFVRSIKENLDQLTESSPSIENHIVLNFKREHTDLDLSLPALVKLSGETNTPPVTPRAPRERKQATFDGPNQV